MIKTAGDAFRLRSLSYGGQVGWPTLRAMNMLGEYANHVPFEARGFIVQVGGNSLDRIAMGHKLGLPRDAWRALCACQLIHRGITDLAWHRFAVVHHRKCERQPLAIVPDNLATRQRHKNPRPFEAIMRRPVVSIDQLRCKMGRHSANGETWNYRQFSARSGCGPVQGEACRADQPTDRANACPLI